MSQLNIRFAEEKDVSAIFGLVQELAEYEKLSHEVQASPDDFSRELFGDSPVAQALVGEFEGEIVAMAVFFHNFSTFQGRPGLYLEDLFVKPKCRGMGFGKEMLSRLAQIAVERNCARFEWSVLDWNQPAIDFYKSLGADKMDDWSVFRISGEPLQKLANLKS